MKFQKSYSINKIYEAPEFYLWTHKRWKYDWKPEYASQWIDTLPMPTEANGIKKVD